MSLENIPRSRRAYVELLANAMWDKSRELTPEEIKDFGSPSEYLLELAIAVFRLEISLDQIGDNDVMNPDIW